MLRLVPLLALASAPAPLPTAPLSLEVTPQAGGPWKLLVTNEGDEIVRLAADARLLRLEVTPPLPEPAPGSRVKPKPPKTVECVLPSDFRPSGVVEDRALLLDPGDRWEEAFDPALYCFGAKEREAFVEGAEVVVKLGFAPPKSGKGAPPPPYVATPTSLDAQSLPLKEAVSLPLTLRAELVPTEVAADLKPSVDERDPGAPRLSVSAPSRVDAKDARALVVTTTLKNAGARSMRVHLRRDQLWFDVEGPSGLVRCNPSEAPRAVARDFLTTLGPNQTRSFSVLLQEVCATGTFARPGLYRVRAGALVMDEGEGAYTGVAISPTTTLVRVRTGEGPFYLLPPAVVDDDAKASQAPAPH